MRTLPGWAPAVLFFFWDCADYQNVLPIHLWHGPSVELATDGVQTSFLEVVRLANTLPHSGHPDDYCGNEGVARITDDSFAEGELIGCCLVCPFQATLKHVDARPPSVVPGPIETRPD